METQNEEYTTIDLRKLLFLFVDHLKVILCITVLCAVCGYLVSAFLIPPTYSASADMLVNNAQENNTATTITSADLTASSNLVSTYSIILKSHTILEQVIEGLNLPYTYNQLEEKVSVDSVDNTQVMRITVKDTSPQAAMNIVSKIVELAPDVIMDKVDAGSVKTVDDPWTTGLPVSPSKKKYTAIAGLLGLVACCGVIFLRDMMNDTFMSEEDVRKVLDLPVIGIIPLEDESTNAKAGSRKGSAH